MAYVSIYYELTHKGVSLDINIIQISLFERQKPGYQNGSYAKCTWY